MPGQVLPSSSPALFVAGSNDQKLKPNAGGGKYTPVQVAEIWTGANPGSSDSLTIVMVAIAGAESGYNTDADNGIAAGLWQVNYHAHP